MSKPIENKKRNYMEYVQKKLKKYRVNSPDKVKDKKKFFKELDKGWESKKEKKEKKKAEVTASVKEKVIKATILIIAGVDSGAVHVALIHEAKSLKLLKDKGIKILHVNASGTSSKKEKTIFMDVKHLKKASELLAENGIQNTRSH